MQMAGSATETNALFSAFEGDYAGTPIAPAIRSTEDPHHHALRASEGKIARGGASYGRAGPTETVGTTAYGVEPDPQRIAYYRLLWDLSP
jgi:hypothetical protein